MIKRAASGLLLAAAGLLLLGLSLSGCRERKAAGPGDAAGKGSATPGDGANAQTSGDLASMSLSDLLALGQSLSLFKGTPLATDQPDAIALSRDGSNVFAHGLNRAEGKYYILRLPIADGNLGIGQFFREDERLQPPFVGAHPRAKEALATAQYQAGPSLPIVDIVSRLSPDFPEVAKGVLGVPYNSAPGFPKVNMGEAAMDLAPFYNWVGDKVIVPLKDYGLSIVPAEGLDLHFVGYPVMEGGFTGMALGVLPDDHDKEYIWLSKWRIEPDKDTCTIWLLDVQSLQWQEIVTLDWVVYDIAAFSVWDSPWLVNGSRAPNAKTADDKYHAPQEGATGVRVPRLARIFPSAGMMEPVEFQGNPVWNVALDPVGQYIAYMDRRRHAMVRVEPATGKVDIDPRWYSDDTETKVEMSEGGDVVLFWKNDILLRGTWSKHEDFEGYDERKAADKDLPDASKLSKPGPADMPDEEEEGQPAAGDDNK